jgi:hydroxymethylpyrimidine pyrophosphatase-like HAD family hydrolase
MVPAPRLPSTMLTAVVSDVDGTLVTDYKMLTARSRAAVARLRANDIAFAIMFERSGLSIAMGNASPEVQRAADFVTDRNSGDGFATAIDWFILGGNRSNAPAPGSAAGSHTGVAAAEER